MRGLLPSLLLAVAAVNVGCSQGSSVSSKKPQVQGQEESTLVRKDDDRISALVEEVRQEITQKGGNPGTFRIAVYAPQSGRVARLSKDSIARSVDVALPEGKLTSAPYEEFLEQLARSFPSGEIKKDVVELLGKPTAFKGWRRDLGMMFGPASDLVIIQEKHNRVLVVQFAIGGWGPAAE